MNGLRINVIDFDAARELISKSPKSHRFSLRSPLRPIFKFRDDDSETGSDSSAEDLALSAHSTTRTLVDRFDEPKLTEVEVEGDALVEDYEDQRVRIRHTTPACTYTMLPNGASELCETFMNGSGYPTSYTVHKAGNVGLEFMGLGGVSSPEFEEEVEALVLPKPELAIHIDICVEVHTTCRYAIESEIDKPKAAAAKPLPPVPTQSITPAPDQSLTPDGVEVQLPQPPSPIAGRRPRSRPNSCDASIEQWRNRRHGMLIDAGLDVVTDQTTWSMHSDD